MSDVYRIYDMRCEYRREPVGICCEEPCFSWKICPAGERCGRYQRAYQIRVYDIGGRDVWNSGKIESEKQNGIACQASLDSHSVYFWRVRIWDERGNGSGWSEAQRIVTALREEDWRGSWITYDGIREIYPFRDHVWIRRTVTLETSPGETFFYLASLGSHDLYINGRKVADTVLAPARSCLRGGRITVNYVTYEISPFLKKGSNVIGIAMDAGFSRMNPDLVPALRIQAYGENLEFHSDTDWICTANGNQYLGGFRWGDYGGERTVVPAWETKWSTDAWNTEGWHLMKPLSVKYKLREQAVEPDKIVEVLQPAEIRGGTEMWIDMGRNFTGWLKLRLPKLERDIVVEVSDKRGDRCAFHQRVIYGAGLEYGGWYCSQFNYISGRFFTVTGLEKCLEKSDIFGLVISNAMERRSAFSCENRLFNQIYETDLHTYQANTVGGITADCPHRERLGYGETAANTTWPDGLLQFDAGAFYRNYLYTWKDTQRMDGYFAHTAPDHIGGGGTVWSSYPIIGCADFYRYYGDRGFLSSMYQALSQWAHFLIRQEKEGLLTRYEFEEWDFLGDWATPDGDDWGNTETALYFNNCCYAYVLQQMGKFAQILDKTEDCGFFREKHRETARAVCKRFWKMEGYFCKRDARYQGAALAAEIVWPEKEAQVWEELLQIIEEKQYVDGGSAGTTLLLRLLSGIHEGNRLVYQWMCKTDAPSYGNFLARGETTWPEMWDMREIYGASRIHTCYTGCASWFLEGLCGVGIGQEGITITPFIPEDMGWAQCEVDTLWGKVYFRWEKQKDDIAMTLEIPFPAKAALVFRDCYTELCPGRQTFTFPQAGHDTAQ